MLFTDNRKVSMANWRSSDFTGITLFIISILAESCVYSRIHHFKLEQDARNYFPLSTFGFLKEGTLIVNISKFSVIAKPSSVAYRNNAFGFMLVNIARSGSIDDMEGDAETCLYRTYEDKEFSFITFRFDFQENVIHIERRGKDVKNLIITNRPGSDKSEVPNNTETDDVMTTIPLQNNSGFYSTYFLVYTTMEGMYRLYFYNCHGLIKTVESSSIDLTVNLVEHNDGSFLSAGEMPIPFLYFISTAVYLAAALLWAAVLHRCKEDALKIHYLMLSVVVFTGLTCFFHAVDMYYIGKEGLREEAWAVLYYIAAWVQGTLLFITILLIGAGFGFIKHVLSCREKILLIIVIPIQVLDCIARVLVEESEEGQSHYEAWRVIVPVVDILCWVAILFPLVWSIRHFQQDSRNAATSMTKQFRQFYFMIVCYVYVSRIIVYLLKIGVPFRYEWLNELLKEITTAVFFLLTGYKFHPAPCNLYLQVPQESDIKMDEVITKTGAMDATTKVNRHKGNSV